METKPSLLTRAVEFASKERFLVGASVFRLLGGLTILYQYLNIYPIRQYIFGPQAVWKAEWSPNSMFSLFTMFSSLRGSTLYFELLYHFGILVTALWVIGWRTRILGPIVFAMFWSMHERTPQLWDGGDNLATLIMIYLMFANVGAFFSLDARRRRRAGKTQPIYGVPAILHNAAILACAIQICLVYGVAGLTKVQGEVWQNGTALYYALHGQEFRLVKGLNQALFRNGDVIALLTYATVAFQICFTFMIFLGGRVLRLITLSIALSFHAAIGGVMGLTTFAAFLTAADLMLVTDDEYRAIGGFLRRRSAALGRLATRARAWLPARPRAAQAHRDNAAPDPSPGSM